MLFNSSDGSVKPINSKILISEKDAPFYKDQVFPNLAVYLGEVLLVKTKMIVKKLESS